MWIKYLVPEDGDDPAHPNVFQLDCAGDPTLADIKEAFPIPGEFHFRAMRVVGSSTVWMDLVNPTSPVQPYQGSVLLKASRLFTDSQTAPKAPVPVPAAAASAVEKPTPPPAKPPKPQATLAQEKLLSFQDDEPAPAAASSAPKAVSPAPFFDTTDDLLGMGAPAPVSASASAAKSSSSSTDLFGLETLQPTRGSSPMNPTPMGAMGSRPIPSMPMGGAPQFPQGGMGRGVGGAGVGGPAPMASKGLGAAGMKPGGAYDPFNDIMSMGGSKPQQGGYPQQNQYNRR